MNSNKKKKTFRDSSTRPKSVCKLQSMRISKTTRLTPLKLQLRQNCKSVAFSSNSKKRSKPWKLITSELLLNWNRIKTLKRVYSITSKTNSSNSRKTKSNSLQTLKTQGRDSKRPHSSFLKRSQNSRRWESHWQFRRRKKPC